MEKLRRMKNKKGFTLVELMVVVVILGVLTAVAIPVYNSVTARAEQKACDANVRTYMSAVEQYKMMNGAYPTNIDELDSFMEGNVVCPSTKAKYTLTAGENGAAPKIKCTAGNDHAAHVYPYQDED